MLNLLAGYTMWYVRVLCEDDQPDLDRLAWPAFMKVAEGSDAPIEVQRRMFPEQRKTDWFRDYLATYVLENTDRPANHFAVVEEKRQADGQIKFLLNPDTGQALERTYHYDWVDQNGGLESVITGFTQTLGMKLIDEPTRNNRMYWLHAGRIFEGPADLTDDEFTLLAAARLKQFQWEQAAANAQQLIERERALQDAREILASDDLPQHRQTSSRAAIPAVLQRQVWQRDGGRCVNCASNELLEYDHIIPVSQGGANTLRNLQLLCQRCNRVKGARVGGQPTFA